MPNYSLRKPALRKKKTKITIPTELPTLNPVTLANYKQIFIVDLQSFSNKSCNRILNQALFSKLKDNNEAIVFIVMKSKFSPACRECGIGKKGDTLFLKDRFIKEGNGRVIFQLDSSIGSLSYRKELCKYIYKYNTNIVLLSEDRQYGYTIIGSDTPNDETEIYNCYFETFDDTDDNSTTTTATSKTSPSTSPSTTDVIENISNLYINDDESSTKEQPQPQQPQQPIKLKQPHKTKEEQMIDLQNKISSKVESWIKSRVEKGDSINLPKTIESLEKSIQPFCKVTHSFSNNAEIIKKLSECGDIKICDTCQTCKPTSTNLDNQFYFSYLSLSTEEHRQFDWLLKKIITEYTKTPTNLVPLNLVSINKFTLSERVEINPTIVIDHLIKNNVISMKSSSSSSSSSNNASGSKSNESDSSSNNDSYSYSYNYGSSSTSSSFKASTPTKTTNYGTPTKKLLTKSPIKTTTIGSPLKKNYTSSKYSYTSSLSNSSSNYSSSSSYDKTSQPLKGKIIYNNTK